MTATPGWFGASPTPEHGTYARYGAPHRCRCDKCRAGNAAYQRQNRQRNGNRDVKQQRYATRVAAHLFRERFPDEWRQILDAALERVQAEDDE